MGCTLGPISGPRAEVDLQLNPFIIHPSIHTMFDLIINTWNTWKNGFWNSEEVKIYVYTRLPWFIHNAIFSIQCFFEKISSMSYLLWYSAIYLSMSTKSLRDLSIHLSIAWNKLTWKFFCKKLIKDDINCKISLS
jgi:hypothetical protein